MVCISAVCAGYAFIAAISSWIRCLVKKAWLFFVTDQVLFPLPSLPSWKFFIPTYIIEHILMQSLELEE
jgi:hypothetical protein